MPLLLKKQDNNISVYIWKINETIENLIEMYPDINFKEFRLEKRTLENLCTRILLKNHSKELKISYSKNGAPKLNNNENISISHCNNLVSVAISKNPIGLDIEEISKKSFKVQSKFVNDNQTNLTNEKSTLIWCIKESVFKYHGIGNVNFKDDIFIPDFSEKIKGILDVKFKNTFLKAHFFKIENKYLVYVCK